MKIDINSISTKYWRSKVDNNPERKLKAQEEQILEENCENPLITEQGLNLSN
jgi:hypothetical protein